MTSKQFMKSLEPMILTNQPSIMESRFDSDWQAELAAIEAESIGWQPLGENAYLHLGKPEEEEIVISVVGVPEVGMNVLLGW